MKKILMFTVIGLSLALGISSSAFAFSIPQPAAEVAASKLAQIQIRAQQGDSDAQYLLGLMYLSGRFVAMDATVGVQWMLAAAEQGHAKAQQTVADLSFEGQLIKRDLSRAEHWYLVQSEQGNRWAHFRLGFIYAAGGDGVSRHCGKAVDQFSAVGDQVSLGNVAWILATCPEAEYRNGNKAVALSLKLLEGDENSPTNLDNLAAAYAESGDFSAAIVTQQKAIEALARSAETAKVDEFQQRLQFYQQRRAYREVLPLLD